MKMLQILNKHYRWIGLAGIMLITLSQWIDGIIGLFYVDPVANLLLLIFALLYWKGHRDIFSILLVLCVVMAFIMSVMVFTT